MDADERQPRAMPPEPATPPIGPIGLSRRKFITTGSVTAVGLVWATPKVSTIRFAAKAAAGSPPPTSSTTSTSTPVGTEGSMSVDTTGPCPGQRLHVKADGFVGKTAIAIQLDSPANVLGTTTCNANGGVNVQVPIGNASPGPHILRAVGVKPGGQTMVLTVPIVVKTEAECKVQNEGTTTVPGSTTPGTSTPPTSTSPTTAKLHQQGDPGGPVVNSGGGSLAFTGANSTGLALVGGAAALAGWGLYAAGAEQDPDADDLDAGQ